MAIIKVRPAGPPTRTGGPSDRRYTTTWIVDSDDLLDGPNKVTLDPRIPRFGDYFQFGNDWDLLAVVVDKTATPDPKRRTRWTCTVQYSSALEGQAEAQQQDIATPLDLRPKFQGRPYVFRRVVEQDANGKPYANSAGDLFDPPEEEEISWHLLTMTRNEASVRWALNEIKGKTNLATLWGQPPGRIKLDDWSWSQDWHGTRPIYPHTYTFLVSGKDGFSIEKLDRGFYELVDDKDQPKLSNGSYPKIRRRIRDAEGNALEKESFLDGQGKVLDPSKPPVKIPFEKFQKADFSQLQLPDLPDYVAPSPPP